MGSCQQSSTWQAATRIMLPNHALTLLAIATARGSETVDTGRGWTLDTFLGDAQQARFPQARTSSNPSKSRVTYSTRKSYSVREQKVTVPLPNISPTQNVTIKEGLEASLQDLQRPGGHKGDLTPPTKRTSVTNVRKIPPVATNVLGNSKEERKFR